jgi:hypothetical protein
MRTLIGPLDRATDDSPTAGHVQARITKQTACVTNRRCGNGISWLFSEALLPFENTCKHTHVLTVEKTTPMFWSSTMYGERSMLTFHDWSIMLLSGR